MRTQRTGKVFCSREEIDSRPYWEEKCPKKRAGEGLSDWMINSAKSLEPLLREQGHGQKRCLPQLVGDECRQGERSERRGTEGQEERSRSHLPPVLLQPEGTGGVPHACTCLGRFALKPGWDPLAKVCPNHASIQRASPHRSVGYEKF